MYIYGVDQIQEIVVFDNLDHKQEGVPLGHLTAACKELGQKYGDIQVHIDIDTEWSLNWDMLVVIKRENQYMLMLDCHEDNKKYDEFLEQHPEKVTLRIGFIQRNPFRVEEQVLSLESMKKYLQMLEIYSLPCDPDYTKLQAIPVNLIQNAIGFLQRDYPEHQFQFVGAFFQDESTSCDALVAFLYKGVPYLMMIDTVNSEVCQQFMRDYPDRVIDVLDYMP